ncbi:MAG: hypothetical protein CYG60_14450 [Actinobacteria bacterium]|nr:MAG: hypothetical protein CYG60_14450 [Actinomycetota bacterium]
MRDRRDGRSRSESYPSHAVAYPIARAVSIAAPKKRSVSYTPLTCEIFWGNWYSAPFAPGKAKLAAWDR